MQLTAGKNSVITKFSAWVSKRQAWRLFGLTLSVRLQWCVLDLEDLALSSRHLDDKEHWPWRWTQSPLDNIIVYVCFCLLKVAWELPSHVGAWSPQGRMSAPAAARSASLPRRHRRRHRLPRAGRVPHLRQAQQQEERTGVLPGLGRTTRRELINSLFRLWVPDTRELTEQSYWDWSVLPFVVQLISLDFSQSFCAPHSLLICFLFLLFSSLMPLFGWMLCVWLLAAAWSLREPVVHSGTG